MEAGVLLRRHPEANKSMKNQSSSISHELRKSQQTATGSHLTEITLRSGVSTSFVVMLWFKSGCNFDFLQKQVILLAPGQDHKQQKHADPSWWRLKKTKLSLLVTIPRNVCVVSSKGNNKRRRNKKWVVAVGGKKTYTLPLLFNFLVTFWYEIPIQKGNYSSGPMTSDSEWTSEVKEQWFSVGGSDAVKVVTRWFNPRVRCLAVNAYDCRRKIDPKGNLILWSCSELQV